METFDNKSEWIDDFQSNWLEHLKQTGEINWKLYKYARNRTPVSAPGIDPKASRLLLITTSGTYLKASQTAFDAASAYGDYTTRVIPMDTPLAALDYAHEHYDHKARQEDPQVNLPLRYLEQLVMAGEIGSVTPSFVSFSGYQPDAGAVVDKMIPEILQLAKTEEATAALLIPV